MASGPILLTCGTGLLGRWILRALSARGLPVRLLARDPAAAAGLARAGVDAVRGAVTDRAAGARACAGAAAVIHAPAAVSSWERDPRTFDRVNVEGLRAVALSARAAGAAPLVAVSSFFALGPTDGITGDESLSGGPRGRFSNDYERTKTLAEAEGRALLERGHPVITVYPGVLYGPGPRRESNLVGALLEEAGAGRLKGLPGGGDRRWCFTYVEDAGEGVVRALEGAAPGDRFVLGGENATLRGFFDRVEESGGPAVPRRRIPYAAMSALGAASEWLAGLGGPRPKITRGAAAVFRREWAYSSRRAARALGWSSRSLAAGIPPTLADLRAGGRIP